MEKSETFTKYEKARILGARALQLSMDSPVLMKIEDEALSDLNYDPLRIAEIELNEGVLPISVNRPLPVKKDEKLKEIKVEKEIKKESDAKKIEQEEKEVKEIQEVGEIMELASPEDEKDEGVVG